MIPRLLVLVALLVAGCGGGAPTPASEAGAAAAPAAPADSTAATNPGASTTPAAAPPPGAPRAADTPGPKDRCPVCGMFVAPYRPWIARLTWPDGTRRFFDGPKDLFLALRDPAKHLPGLPPVTIEGAAVTEYYDLRMIPAAEAFFVVGSDVTGPMGAELVPLADAPAAEDFRGDHGGRKTLRASEVDAAVLAALSK